MPRQRLGQQVRRVLATAAVARALQVVAQGGAKVRVGAFVDDEFGALRGREAAQIGQALLGNDDLHIVLGVVHVRGHGHDARDGAALGHRGRHEERQVAVARKVARAADAVHDAGAHDVRGVDVAVDVGLDHGVHGDHAQAAHQLGVVADLLRAQHDALAVEVDVAREVFQRRRAQRQRRGRGAGQLAAAQHVQHAVLQHFGVGGEVLKRPLVQPGQHRVGDVAHARLQRQQVGGQAAQLHLLLHELDDVPGNLLGHRIGCGKRGVAVGLAGVHHGNHLAQVAAQVGLANALIGRGHGDGLAVRRAVGAVVDVVHPFQAGVLQVVDLQDDFVGLVQPGLVVAHRGRRNQAPVGQHAGHLHHRHIELAQKTEPDKLRHVREVDVHVLHLPGIDALAAGRVGLVGHAHFNAADLGQRAVQLWRRGGARPQADLERLALGVQRLDAPRQRHGHRLGVTRAGKTAHAHIGTGRNKRCRLVG